MSQILNELTVLELHSLVKNTYHGSNQYSMESANSVILEYMMENYQLTKAPVMNEWFIITGSILILLFRDNKLIYVK